MSVMVKKLYKNGSFLYNMKLVAGQSGLDNIVQWVHIIEDNDVISFLHGHELVFTAGILNKHKEWLLHFAMKMKEVNASALVVNIGPHTTYIPEEVIHYCNEVSLPLFTIPWKTKMVDMTRDFCQRIIKNQQVENNIETNMKNIIFNVKDFETQVLQVERYGYQRDSKLCFISMVANIRNDPLDMDTDLDVEEYKISLKMIAEKMAKSIHELYISFLYKESLILVLVNYTDAEIDHFVKEFLKNTNQKSKGQSLHLGISANQIGLYNQNKNFEKAVSAMKMACNLKRRIFTTISWVFIKFYMRQMTKRF